MDTRIYFKDEGDFDGKRSGKLIVKTGIEYAEQWVTYEQALRVAEHYNVSVQEDGDSKS